MGLWVPKLRAEYIIEGALYQEALDYARRSRAYTSDRHDFHSGGLDNKQQKMLEGKLGEKAFKLFLQDNGIRFEEDHSSYEERDEYDFLLQGSGLCLRVDVKTRTEEFHIRTLELVEQTISHPKELYVSDRLYREPECGPAAGVVHPGGSAHPGEDRKPGLPGQLCDVRPAAAPDGIAGPALPPGTSRYKTDSAKKTVRQGRSFLIPRKGAEDSW